VSNMSRGLVLASSVTVRDVAFLWEPYLPLRKLTWVEGDPDVGKSIVLYDLAARVTRGWAMPPSMSRDEVNEPHNVLVLSSEDDADDMAVPRLAAAGADLARLHLFEPGDGEPLLLPRDKEILRGYVRDTGARLAVLDNYFDFSEGHRDVVRGENANLMPLMAIARDEECAFALVRHNAKRTTDNAKHRGQGPNNMGGKARSGLSVSIPDITRPQTRSLTTVKNNLALIAPPLTFEVASSIENPKVPVIVWFPSRSVGERPPARKGPEEVLCDLTSSGPIPMQEALAGLHEAGYEYQGGGERTQGLRDRAEIVSYRPKGEKGWFWDRACRHPEIWRKRHSADPSDCSDCSLAA
jgi:hypothetical protein